MKKFIIGFCMNYIKRNTNYNNTKLKEIEYGLVSIYLMLYKIIIICIISILLGIIKETIIFILLFNILRMPAFGLHATKSWICLLSSIIIFIVLPMLAIYLSINLYLKILLGLIGTILMYKNAPADTYKRPIVNKKRRNLYKRISTLLSFTFGSVSLLINNDFISNCLIFSIILENLLISPYIYRLFRLPYNNYISYLKNHPDFAQ